MIAASMKVGKVCNCSIQLKVGMLCDIGGKIAMVNSDPTSTSIPIIVQHSDYSGPQTSERKKDLILVFRVLLLLAKILISYSFDGGIPSPSRLCYYPRAHHTARRQILKYSRDHTQPRYRRVIVL
jgi:hypothetical protein